MSGRPLTVAFDVLSDVPGQSGQVNIHRNVIRYLPGLRPAWRILVFATPRLRAYYEHQLGGIATRVEWIDCRWDNLDGSLRRMLTQEVQIPLLMRRLRPDVFISYPLPFLLRSWEGIVVNRHTRPMLEGGLKVRYGNVKAAFSIRHATCTIFNSVAEREKLLAQGIVAPKNAVVAESYDDRIFHDSTEISLQPLVESYRRTLPPGTLVFVPAGLQPRKNSEVVLEALRLLLHAGVECRIVFMGSNDPAYAARLGETYADLMGDRRVVVLGHRTHDDVAAVGVLADFVVYPSTVETFGLPPLEMMRLRKPVILSDLDVLVEVAGSGAMLFDRFNPADLAAKMRSLMENPALRTELAGRGYTHSRRFSWEQNVRATAELIEQLVNDHGA